MSAYSLHLLAIYQLRRCDHRFNLYTRICSFTAGLLSCLAFLIYRTRDVSFHRQSSHQVDAHRRRRLRTINREFRHAHGRCPEIPEGPSVVRCDDQNKPLLDQSASHADQVLPLMAGTNHSNLNADNSDLEKGHNDGDVTFTCGPASPDQDKIAEDDDDDVFVTSPSNSFNQ